MQVDSTYAEKSRISVVIIVAIVAPIVVILLVAFFVCWIISVRRTRKKYSSVPEESDGMFVWFGNWLCFVTSSFSLVL